MSAQPVVVSKFGSKRVVGGKERTLGELVSCEGTGIITGPTDLGSDSVERHLQRNRGVRSPVTRVSRLQ